MIPVAHPTYPAPPLWEDRHEHVEALIAAALAAVDPEAGVAAKLGLEGDRVRVGDAEFPLDAGSRVYVVGAGKAGVGMGRAAVKALGGRVSGGVMAVPELPSGPLGGIEWIAAGHPLPDEGSLAAGRKMAELLSGTRPHDLVLILLSGGGSALLELPVEGLTLADLRAVNGALLRSGATIHEVNMIRQQLSQIKGGGLARMAAPARAAALVLSDVAGDDLRIVASGPALPPAGTRREALAVVERHGLAAEFPPAVLERLAADDGSAPDQVPEVPHALIGSNRAAARAAVEEAERLGFRALLLTTHLRGEARRAGRRLAGLARSIRCRGGAWPGRPSPTAAAGGSMPPGAWPRTMPTPSSPSSAAPW